MATRSKGARATVSFPPDPEVVVSDGSTITYWLPEGTKITVDVETPDGRFYDATFEVGTPMSLLALQRAIEFAHMNGAQANKPSGPPDRELP